MVMPSLGDATHHIHACPSHVASLSVLSDPRRTAVRPLSVVCGCDILHKLLQTAVSIQLGCIGKMNCYARVSQEVELVGIGAGSADNEWEDRWPR